MNSKNDNRRISTATQFFLIDRQARHLSNRTLDFYNEKLGNFQFWLKQKNIDNVDEITPSIVRQYLIYLEQTHNPGGVHAHWRCVKAFFFWFEDEYDLPNWSNPIRKVTPPKYRSNPIPGIPMSDVQSMIDVCDHHTFVGLRDVAIFRTLVDTGCRRKEFCDLRIMDLNIDNGELKILNGKGNKERTVFVGPTARRDIIRYLRRRPSRDPRDWLWVTVSNTALQPDGVREILRRRAMQANVPIPSPHDFRRTFALECLRNGMDLVQLMRLMGHTSTSVLQRYLALQTDDLSNAHNAFGPIDHVKRRTL